MAKTRRRTEPAGARLLRWRTKAGLSQDAAGKLVGVTQATWCDWEQGKKVPHLENALRIAEITRGECPVGMFANGGEAA